MLLHLGPGICIHKWHWSFLFALCVCAYHLCLVWVMIDTEMVFPGGSAGKEFFLQCRRCERCSFSPWVGDIPLEEKMATQSYILAWKIPWTEESGGLQAKGSQRVGHYWVHTATKHRNELGIISSFQDLEQDNVEQRYSLSLDICCYSITVNLRLLMEIMHLLLTETTEKWD